MRFNRYLALVLAAIMLLTLCAVGKTDNAAADTAETAELAEQEEPAGLSEPEDPIEPEATAEPDEPQEADEPEATPEPSDEPDDPADEPTEAPTEAPTETPAEPVSETEPEQPATEPEETDIPVGNADEDTIPETAEDSTETTTFTGSVWAYINALESASLHPKRSGAPTANDFAAFSDEIADAVVCWDGYVDGSLIRNGECVYWRGTDGVTYGYSPDLRAKVYGLERSSGSKRTVLTGDKGGVPGSQHVTTFQPFYGIDSNFTNQYADEAVHLAGATGGAYSVYRGYDASIDAIADAIESSAVVLLDSHGLTDTMNLAKANTSYIALTSGDGLTSKDYAIDVGSHGAYAHAFSAYESTFGIRIYCVDGTAIANHMKQIAPNNMVWVATCLGMATDGFCRPLRNKGVEVVYGYSQSVTFGADFEWEYYFWKRMCDGATVAQAAAYMKEEFGAYDVIDAMYNHSGRPAYPIFVSDEDPYPGQGRVDQVQNVKSTWIVRGLQMPTDLSVELNRSDVLFRGDTPYVLYNSSAQTPRITVKNVRKLAVDPSQFTVVYRNNTKPGTAQVEVTMNETGKKETVWFKIYLPATVSTNVCNTQSGIQISWKPVAGAKGYVIYRRAWNLKDSGWTTFERWNNTTKTTWTDTKVYAGTRYQYGVKAYFNDPMDNYNLGMVGPLKTTVRITNRMLSSVTGGSKKLTIRWAGSNVFTGYQIQISPDRNFSKDVKTVTINKAKAYETTVKNLRSNTAYYVRVRSFHVFDGTLYYGGWSNVLSTKTR